MKPFSPEIKETHKKRSESIVTLTRGNTVDTRRDDQSCQLHSEEV